MAHSATVIPEKIYFKIGEVCELVGVQPHVLRYWETEFPMLSPQKNRSGQRSYRRRDVEMALRIKELLYDEMFTIAGAKKKLQSENREGTRLKIVHPEPQPTNHDHAPAPRPSEPSLFDEDLELDDIDTDDNHREFPPSPEPISSDKRQTILTVAAQLLELREMLRRPPGSPHDGI
jgi:DNA-binding transcriptional MerR regulator